MIITSPDIHLIPKKTTFGRQRYRLENDWIIILDDGLVLLTPKGFETDLASIPRLFWLIPGFTPTGPLMYGSISHDQGYQHQYLLTPFSKKRTYPRKSMELREQFPIIFGDLVPVFVGRNRQFFDNFLAGVTIAATGNWFIANTTKAVLKPSGFIAWNKYRCYGPSAYNENSLGLPGLTRNGAIL